MPTAATSSATMLTPLVAVAVVGSILYRAGLLPSFVTTGI